MAGAATADPGGFEVAFTPVRDNAIPIEELPTVAKLVVRFSPEGIPDAYLDPETVFDRQRQVYEAINRKYELQFERKSKLALPGVPGQQVVVGHFRARYGPTVVLEQYVRIPCARWEIILACDYPEGDSRAKGLLEQMQRSLVVRTNACGWLRAPATGPVDRAAVVRRARQCTVLIMVKNSKGEVVATGSGFLVHPAGYLLSNPHVVRPSDEDDEESKGGPPKLTYQVHWDSREGRAPVPARYVADVRSEYLNLDFGLLKLDGTGWPYLELESASELDNLAEVIAASFPKPDPTAEHFDITIQRGVVTRIKHDARGRVASLLTDMQYDRGSSGSPCLNARSGRVVGINTFVQRGSLAVFGGILPIDTVLEHFEPLRYPPEGSGALTVLDHYKLACLFWALDRPATAERLLQRVLSLDENHAPAWHLRGLVWQEADRPKARSYFETALRIEPDCAPALAALAVWHLAEPKPDFPRCSELLDRLVRASPEEDAGFRLRAELFRRHNLFEAALTNLDEAIRLGRDLSPAPYVELAQVCAQRGKGSDHQRALDALDKALAIDPVNAEALRVWAQLHANAPQVALERFTRLAQAHPKHPTAQWLLARFQHRTGDAAGAAQRYETALKLFLAQDTGLPREFFTEAGEFGLEHQASLALRVYDALLELAVLVEQAPLLAEALVGLPQTMLRLGPRPDLAEGLMRLAEQADAAHARQYQQALAGARPVPVDTKLTDRSLAFALEHWGVSLALLLAWELDWGFEPDEARASRQALAGLGADPDGFFAAAKLLKLVRQVLALKTARTNSLGMKFVPVPGTEVLFCIWETRVKDFAAFVQDRARNGGYNYRDGEQPWVLKSDGWKQRGWAYGWDNPGFTQTPDHPVTCVSWHDAKAFCDWLTRRERQMGLIASDQYYRLPYDWEWSVAVGLNEPRSGTPKDKDEKIQGVYPWGSQWPPPAGAGNYAGEESRTSDTPAGWGVIEGYRDGYPRTAPVGSFAPNKFGLYDMGGNVWEWCEDWYDPATATGRVLRGGSWNLFGRGLLLSSYRDLSAPGIRFGSYGFRVVLVAGSSR